MPVLLFTKYHEGHSPAVMTVTLSWPVTCQCKEDGWPEEKREKNTYESLLCTYGPLSTFLLVFMAGLIFFNLSENQFVHDAARLLSRALHHTSIDLACLSKALCWMLVIRNRYTEINECIDG